MDRVTLLLLAVLGLGPHVPVTPSFAEPLDTAIAIDQWRQLIADASQRFGMPEAWIRAVMQAESGGRTMLNGRPITSSAGALGLMQIMPDTYEELRQRYGLGADPHDPHDNIYAGTAYLRELYDRFGYPGLFTAYHAGPGRYGDYLAYGRALPAETLGYLDAMGQPGSRTPTIPTVASSESLFFPLRNTMSTASGGPPASVSDGLFVPLHPALQSGP